MVHNFRIHSPAYHKFQNIPLSQEWFEITEPFGMQIQDVVIRRMCTPTSVKFNMAAAVTLNFCRKSRNAGSA